MWATRRATSSAVRPASTCFSAAIICASLCLLLLIQIPLKSDFHTCVCADPRGQVSAPGIVGELILKCSVAEPVVRGRTDKISPSVIAIDYVKRPRLLRSSSHEIRPVLRILQSIIKRTAPAVGIVNEESGLADEVVVIFVEGKRRDKS